MAIIDQIGATKILRCPNLLDFDFDIDAASRDRATSGDVSLSDLQVEDMVVDRYTGALVAHEFDINITSISDATKFTFSFESSDEDVATVDSLGMVTRVSDGDVTIYVKTPWLKKYLNLNISSTGGQDIDVFKNWYPGTLARTIVDSFKTRISGKTLGTTYAQPFINGSKNPNLWCGDVDLSPFAASGNRYAGIAVSPRHVIYSAHVREGGSFTFIGTDGVAVTRSSSAYDESFAHDIGIAYLSSDLPNTIVPAKILPTNWVDYLPNIQYGIPCVMMNSDPDYAAIGQVESMGGGQISVFPPDDSELLEWYDRPVGGDSGGVVFTIADDKGIALTNWWGKHADDWTVGPNFTTYQGDINAIMTDMHGSSEYQLQYVDLTGYPSY